MGLDNYPIEKPCYSENNPSFKVVRNKEKKIDCDKTNCPFKHGKGRRVFGMFGTYCWLRGKYYEGILEKLEIDDSLYNEHNLEETESLLRELKNKELKLKKLVALDHYSKEDVGMLVWWLETLVKCETGFGAWS